MRPLFLDPVRVSTQLEVHFSSKMQSISAFPSSVHCRRLFEYRNLLQASSPISPLMESPDQGSGDLTNVAKASFDSSLAIILAALLCSVLCALGVSAVVRCRLRCRRWLLVSEPSLVVGVEGANTGIKKIDIKALPTTVYRTGFPNPGMDCPICLAEFVEGEKVRVLPECCHSFHADCIDAWLVSNPSCPSCRHSLLYVFLKKSSQPGAENGQSARMDVAQRNDSVGINNLVQSFHTSARDTAMVASSTLNSNSVQSGDQLE